MFIIGEKINGMFKNVKDAIKERNTSVIKELAVKQIEAGADALDVNVGLESLKPVEDMEWLVKTIREVTNLPLAIDTTKPEVMERGLEVAGDNSIINSISADPSRLEKMLPIVKKYNRAKIIALTLDRSGVPLHSEKRIEIATNLLATFMEEGIDVERIYIDPVILPVNVAQEHSIEVIKTIGECKNLCTPPPKTIVGLSNVSQGTNYRSLIDRTFLIMAIANGLNAAILNPLDKELMNSLITAELLLGKNIYCDSFLQAYRKKK